MSLFIRIRALTLGIALRILPVSLQFVLFLFNGFVLARKQFWALLNFLAFCISRNFGSQLLLCIIQVIDGSLGFKRVVGLAYKIVFIGHLSNKILVINREIKIFDLKYDFLFSIVL